MRLVLELTREEIDTALDAMRTIAELVEDETWDLALGATLRTVIDKIDRATGA